MQLGLELINLTFLPDQDFDWTYSVYGNVQEILPDDMPEPLGKAVTTTTTMDANLNHCLATGKSLTGCLNRKISMIFPLVSCCSCVNKPSSS